MRNKTILLMAALASTLVSCQRKPDWEDMDNEYLVYTQRDPSFDAGSHRSFFIPDSILLIGDSAEPVYLDGRDADNIIASVARNMEEAGYVRSEKKEEADLGIQLSYISCTNYFTGYDASPYWWWGYPGYWDPFYWGGYWGGWWGYSFPVVYSYSENSLLGEMVDLKAPKGDDTRLPIVWNMYVNGDQSDYIRYDSNRMLQGIERAFDQSAYLIKNNVSNEK